MPWVKRIHYSSGYSNPRFYWLLAGVGSVVIGILAGYSWWGDTASIVPLVERQLGESRAEVRRLEKRIQRLEAKVGRDEDDTSSSEPTAKAY